MSVPRIPSPARYSTGFGTILPWSPVLVGVGVVIGYLIWILVVPPGEPSSTAPGGPEAAAPGGPEAAPPGSVPASPPPEPAPGGTPVPSPPPGVTEPPPDPTESPDDFVGRYRLGATDEHTFTGRVVLVNGSDQPRDWRVELEFPPDVGDLVEIWVDGGPEPEVDAAGNRYVLTGSAPVAPVSWVRLTAEFERAGYDIDPVSCTVNGAPCG